MFDQITSPLVREPLERAIRDPKAMTHAWLFTGPPGSGRTIAARVFATALVCPHGGCGKCQACRSVAVGTHPDVQWVATNELTIKVDDIREDIVRNSRTLPVQASRRVVVVEDADRLSESAANVLLKSVEEPVDHLVFIFCAPSTDPQDYSVTLRSRCRHIYVPTPSPQAVKNVLLSDANLSLTDKQAEWAASVTAGHIGRARHLAVDEAARAKRAAALKVPQLVYESNRLYMFTEELAAKAEAEAISSLAEVEARELRELESSLGAGSTGKGTAKIKRQLSAGIKALEDSHKLRRKRKTRDALDLALIDIAGLYRDAMMQAVGAMNGEEPVGGFQHPDMAATSRELARRNSPEALMACIDAVLECREVFERNVAPSVALDAMAGRLRECCNVV